MKKLLAPAIGIVALLAALACSTLTPATPTAPPPTTAVSLTVTSAPPTATTAAPTDTPVPPTATAVAPTDTPLPPTPTTAAPSETPTTASGPCEFTAGDGVTAYTRPNLAADVFGTAPSGETFPVGARTDDGWLGFEPGVAQAANMGVFRYRWVQETDPNLTVSGDCASVPVVVGPTVGVCYDMPMEDVPVYQTPDTASTVIATLHVQDYAALTGMMGTDWAQVDLGQGNTGQTGLGWIQADTLNVNGPCDSLPEVTP